jgi:hypothetical protein
MLVVSRSNCPAEAVGHENNRHVKLTTSHLTHLAIIYNLINTTRQKLKVMYSTIGLQPFIAEPTAIPVKPSSAIECQLLFSPNSASIPLDALKHHCIPQLLHPLNGLIITHFFTHRFANSPLNCIVLIFILYMSNFRKVKINILNHFLHKLL